MRRRDVLLGGLASTGVRSHAVAQGPRRVGIIFVATPVADMAGAEPASHLVRAIVHTLRDLGWIEGRNLVIERRSAEGRPELADGIVADLLARNVDVIMLGSALWLLDAARKATASVPIVAAFGYGQDPAIMGLVASLARPGGNITGVTAITGVELARKRLQLLKELAPGVSRIAFLGTGYQQSLHPPDSGPAGTRLIFVVAEEQAQFDDAFATILRERADALHVGGSGVHYVHRSQIVGFAARHQLPAVYGNREAVDEGGLMAYGPSAENIYRQMAKQVDRLLRGAKPGETPVEQPDKFEFVINLRTAKTLGLTIPPTILARVDEVIE
jgi:putative ABC transport system substrate-binding protein